MKLEGEKTRIVDTSNLSKFFIIVDKNEAKPVGFCGLTKTNELIGLFIEPPYRKQGYAEDVIKTLKKTFALTVTTSVNNIPLQKLLDKLGFKKWYKYES